MVQPAADALSHLKCVAGAVAVLCNTLAHGTQHCMSALVCSARLLAAGTEYGRSMCSIGNAARMKSPPLHVEAVALRSMIAGRAVVDMAGGACCG